MMDNHERLTAKSETGYFPKKQCTVNKNGVMYKYASCGYCDAIPYNEEYCDSCHVKKCFDKLGEFEDMMESGRLVYVPCFVGDIVFQIVGDGFGGYRLAKYEITEIKIWDAENLIFAFLGLEYEYDENDEVIDCLSDAVFLSSEYGTKWFIDESKAKEQLKQIQLDAFNVGDKAYFVWNYNEPEIQECEIQEVCRDEEHIGVILKYVNCLDDCETVKFSVDEYNKIWFTDLCNAKMRVEYLRNK